MSGSCSSGSCSRPTPGSRAVSGSNSRRPVTCPAWFEVLLQLRKVPEGRLKMNQIADAIVHSSGGTTRLIDRIEEAGYVTREHCPSDRRAIYVAISANGNQKLDEALNVHLDYLEDNLAKRLDDQERRTLTTLLKKLNSSAKPS